MATLPAVEVLAREFAAVMREWLTVGELAEIDRKNTEWAAAGGVSICHSHDFCDANQAMIDALARLGVELDFQNDAQSQLINTAWAIAKRDGFSAPRE